MEENRIEYARQLLDRISLHIDPIEFLTGVDVIASALLSSHTNQLCSSSSQQQKDRHVD